MDSALYRVVTYSFTRLPCLRVEDFSRLNGWPMRSPVNASPASSQMPSHDSGASVVRYTFTARDFHSLLFAGFAGALITSFPLTIEPQPV
jgi:hypothetical protein